MRHQWMAAGVVLALAIAATAASPAAAADPHQTVSAVAAVADIRAVAAAEAAAGNGMADAGVTDIGVNAVFGPDNRVLVDPTTVFPASATVLLTFAGGRCTGFMISYRALATAGHCVHTGGSGGSWHTNMIAYPGHNGVTAPYGSCAASALFAPLGWTQSADPRLDYGVVRLNCGIGDATGWFPIGWTSESLTGMCTVSQGYPNDRPGQWRSVDQIRAESAGNVYHQHDTTGGQNGSPIYQTDPDEWCPTWPKPPIPPRGVVLAIHTSGPYGGGPGAVNNVGTRITQAVYNNLMAWR